MPGKFDKYPYSFAFSLIYHGPVLPSLFSGVGCHEFAEADFILIRFLASGHRAYDE